MLRLVCWRCTNALYARNEQYESIRKVFKEFWVRCKNDKCLYSLIGLDLGKRPQPTETEVNLKMRSRKYTELYQSGVKWYAFEQILMTFGMV
jgi:hypothetical protein